MEEMPQHTAAREQRIRTGRRVILAQCAAVAAVVVIFHFNFTWVWWQIVVANLTLLAIAVFVSIRLSLPGRIAEWVPPLGWASGVLPIIAYSLLVGQGSAWIVLLIVVEFLMFAAVPLAVSFVLAVFFSLYRSRTANRSPRLVREESDE